MHGAWKMHDLEGDLKSPKSDEEDLNEIPLGMQFTCQQMPVPYHTL